MLILVNWRYTNKAELNWKKVSTLLPDVLPPLKLSLLQSSFEHWNIRTHMSLYADDARHFVSWFRKIIHNKNVLNWVNWSNMLCNKQIIKYHQVVKWLIRSVFSSTEQQNIWSITVWPISWVFVDRESHRLLPTPGSSGFWPCRRGSGRCKCPRWLWWNYPRSSRWSLWTRCGSSCVPEKNIYIHDTPRKQIRDHVIIYFEYNVSHTTYNSKNKKN